jgi:predicted GNAT superfamily acetyltransferase
MTTEIKDLRNDASAREALLRVNNASARETSLTSRQKFDPGAAFLLAFEQSDDYDGGHFLWFRGRFGRFIYVDRVVVAAPYRRRGLGRLLYADLFRRAEQRGHTHIVCEVNAEPPNPISDAFHAAQGFEEVGTAAIDGGAKIVRYLLRRRP